VISVRERCPTCGLKYSIGPSFNTTSRYVLYVVVIAIAVTIFVILALFNYADNPLTIFISVLVTQALTFPFTGAVSKAIGVQPFIK